MLKALLQRQWPCCVALIFVLLACGDHSAPPVDILATEKKLYSQFDEELIVRDYFQDRRNGVFVDVGAAYPRNGSTTFYLEKHLGWSGIAVDAMAVYAPAWKKHRTNSKFFRYAVTDRSGEFVAFFAAIHPPVSSLIRENARAHVNKETEVKEVTVPTVTLTKLLDDNGVTSIDFLSMDIEGSERPALAGFDIERFAPELVCIEVMPDPEHRKKVTGYFESHGYHRIERSRSGIRLADHDIANWYFEPKSR